MSKVELADICRYRTASVPIDPQTYVSTESMLSNKAGITTASSIPSAGKARVFLKGDTLVSNIRPYFKKIWQANTDGCCSADVLVFEPSCCDSDYLYWLLSSDTFFDYMVATSKGTKMPRGDKASIMHYGFERMDDESQAAIAKALNPIRELICINQQTNDYLSEMLIAIQDKVAMDEQSEEMRADQVFDIHIGKTPPRKQHEWFTFEHGENVIWMSIKDMGNAGLFLIDSSEYLTPEAVDRFNIKPCKPGSVLLSFKLTIGRVGIVANEMVTNEAIACFSSDDPRKLAYIYPQLKAYDYASLGSTSSIATAVNSKMIKAMPITMPSNAALDSFYREAKPC